MNKKNMIVVLADPVLLSPLKDGLSREPDIHILFADSKPEKILSFLNSLNINEEPPVVLVDNSVPVAGPDFYAAVQKKGIPLVGIAPSVSEGFKMLEQGATDMVVRRVGEESDSGAYFYRMLCIHIQSAAKKTTSDRRRDNPSSRTDGKIVAIGSSTGGTETVLSLLKQMPANAPPILIVQHMPPVFTKMYAERANMACVIDVWEARDGDRVESGLALIAPGDFHMTLEKKNDQYVVACRKGERVCGQCPSVDVLFDSVARTAKSDAVGVILTGMGADGASGLLKMRKQGAYTIGQDQETSIVYGMPKAAFEIGAVDTQLPLDKIAREILERADS